MSDGAVVRGGDEGGEVSGGAGWGMVTVTGWWF